MLIVASRLSSCLLQCVNTKTSNVFKVKLQGLKYSISQMSRNSSVRFQSMSLIVYGVTKQYHEIEVGYEDIKKVVFIYAQWINLETVHISIL